MEKWFELEHVASSISFSGDCDSLVWKYNNLGQYLTNSSYNIITFRGVIPIYIPAVWSLVVPDGAVLAPSWEPQEEGMMSTTASFPQLWNQGLSDQ
jgi:hypothetical protein